MDTAAKFVQDIIDKAKTEAAKKLNSEQIVSKQQKSLKLFIDFKYWGKSYDLTDLDIISDFISNLKHRDI